MTAPWNALAPGWTAADIPDLTGRRAVVTGGTAGLGLETATVLARHGASVLLTARDAARGDEAVRRVRAAARGAEVTRGDLDLADLVSVRAFAAKTVTEPLDLLVNNAGLMAVPPRRTADGFELQLGTNHLGHFALTGLLLPALLAGAESGVPARVVTVSSVAHRMGAINFDDLMSDRSYDPWRAYGQSKLANLLFVRELDRRVSSAGALLVSVAAHPGYTRTNLVTAGPATGHPVAGAVLRAATVALGQGVATGALPQLRAATDPGVQGGEFYGPRGLLGHRGLPVRVGRSAAAQDDAVAARLWAESEHLTGVHFGQLEAGSAPEKSAF